MAGAAAAPSGKRDDDGGRKRQAGLGPLELVRATLQRSDVHNSPSPFELTPLAARRRTTSLDQIADAFRDNQRMSIARALAGSGNFQGERETAARLGTLGAEVVFEICKRTRTFEYEEGSASGRPAQALIVPPTNDTPPALLLLVRSHHGTPRVITDDIKFSLDILPHISKIDADRLQPNRNNEAALAGRFLSAGPSALSQLLDLALPEVIIAEAPKMIETCAPMPGIGVVSQGRASTLGVYCHRKDEFGATACRHGTGPAGTAVKVAGIASQVAASDEIQDIAFFPLPHTLASRQVRGLAGARTADTPTQYEDVTFARVGDEPMKTHVEAWNAGLLDYDPLRQLRVQTPPVTNAGDSGSALIDSKDRIVGFAFWRTAYGSKAQFSEWVWAANALSALDLEPLTVSSFGKEKLG